MATVMAWSSVSTSHRRLLRHFKLNFYRRIKARDFVTHTSFFEYWKFETLSFFEDGFSSPMPIDLKTGLRVLQVERSRLDVLDVSPFRDLQVLTIRESLTQTIKIGAGLESVFLGDCSAVQSVNFNGTNQASNLRGLQVSGCTSFKTLAGIQHCPIQVLKIIMCPALICGQVISKLRDIVTLEIRDCDGITDFSFLESLRSLKDVNLSGSQISDLSVLSACLDLRRLNVEECNHLRSLQGIESCTKLTMFSASRCLHLSSVTGLVCSSLGEIDVSHCPISSLSEVHGATQLKYLNISGTLVRDLSFLSKCQGLERVSMYNCRYISDVAPLLLLPNFRGIIFGGADSLLPRSFFDAFPRILARWY